MKWNFAISGCCLLLLAANIALIHQNSELKSRLSLAPPSLEAATGAQMPDMHGFDLTGKPIEVDYGKDPRKVLVLVFSPTCPFCDENWPKWQQVISSLDRSAIRPVAVDLTHYKRRCRESGKLKLAHSIQHVKAPAMKSTFAHCNWR